MKKIFFILLSIFTLSQAAVPTQSVSAFNLFPDRVCSGEAAKSAACKEAKAQSKDDNPVANLIGSATNIIALVAGVVAVLVIIVAGFQFGTSGGNAEQVTKARGRILGAIVGLVIIALAWTIIRLVIDKVVT